jgi:hypothetical protein
MTAFFTGNVQQYRFDRAGLSEPDEREEELSLRWTPLQRGSQQWWREYHGFYGRDFRDYVDGLIRRGEAAG